MALSFPAPFLRLKARPGELTRPMMEELLKQNKLAPGLMNVASTPVAVVARGNAPKPDIHSVESFKQALLTARSIVYADPAKAGLSGVAAARAIEHLGIADQTKQRPFLCLELRQRN